jgi:benzoyl-CoA reductase/2-hydroxyglutaryl-CoA dehydratase subunit BcrC/BadD/HgdB
LTDQKAETSLFTRGMEELVSLLRKNGSGLKAMDPFYTSASSIFTDRVRELEEFKRGGGKVIGVLCNFVPEELIYASGAVPLRLAFGFPETILTAEEHLPRNFCPLIKSSFGSYLMGNPLFEICDVVIVPTTCDGQKKLTELISPHKPAWVLEVPHSNSSNHSRTFWLEELNILRKRIGALTGKRITGRRLDAAIALSNRKRAILRRLYEARRKDPAIWGREALLVSSLVYLEDIHRWMEWAEALCDEVEKGKPLPNEDSPRLLITGSPVISPTWKVPLILEDSGGIVVMDDICTGTKGQWDPVERNYFATDSMVSIADRYLMNTCACFTPNDARMIRLRRFVSDWKVDGVIYQVSQACHTYGMEQPSVSRDIESKGIPVLNIETDFSREDVEQIRTRVEAFIEMLIARKRKASGKGGAAVKLMGRSGSVKIDWDFPVREINPGQEPRGGSA